MTMVRMTIKNREKSVKKLGEIPKNQGIARSRESGKVPWNRKNEGTYCNRHCFE